MQGSLAVDVAGIRARLEKFHVEGSTERGRNYCASPSDVFIATYPKCGTTLMQQIVHGLRSSGDMNFREISEVVPWLEAALNLQQDPADPQPHKPHAFKTHFTYADVPLGGQYIHVTRDPRDMVVSFYNFLSGWMFEPDSIDMDTFVLEFIVGGSDSGRYWDHVVSWWPKLGQADTLMFTFEGIIADLRGTVRKVADFLDLDVADGVIDIATHQSSMEFMKAHGRQFDDHLIRDARNVAAGLPADATTSKLRTGKSGSYRTVLSERVLAALDEQWQHIVLPSTGLQGYAEFAAAILGKQKAL